MRECNDKLDQFDPDARGLARSSRANDASLALRSHLSTNQNVPTHSLAANGGEASCPLIASLMGVVFSAEESWAHGHRSMAFFVPKWLRMARRALTLNRTPACSFGPVANKASKYPIAAALKG